MTAGHASATPWQDGPRRGYAWQHLLAPFEAQARATPQRRAVVCGASALDYAALDAAANRLARHLVRRGVQPGQVVAICLARGVEFSVALLAVLKAGAAYLPLDPRNPPARLDAILRDAAAGLTICSSASRDSMPDGHAVCVCDVASAEIEREAPTPPALPRDPAALAYLIYTSGSTGLPKGAAVTHRSVANLLQWYLRTLGLTEADRTLIIGSTTFDAVQKNLFAPLLVGGELHYPEGTLFDPEALAATIARDRITWVNGTPSTFYPIAEGPGARAPDLLSSLRWVVLGGEPIRPQRLRPWFGDAACNARVLNTYGPTEATDICAAWAFGADDAEPPIPIGRPIDNVRLAIAAADGGPAAPGEAGELVIGGDGVGAGYPSRPDLTAERFRETRLFGAAERAYFTGDRVRCRADGAFEFLGRFDNQVKLRGFRIEPEEIEAALLAEPGIRDAVVLVQEADGAEPRLVAHVVADAARAAEPAVLRQALARRLPDYMLPAAILRHDAFPTTQNGKADRAALVRSAPPPRAAVTAGATPTERLVAGIWARRLPAAPLGRDTNFFDAGATSLDLAGLQADLDAALGRGVPIVLLFGNPTLRSLAAALDHGPGHAAPPRAAAPAIAAREALAARRAQLRAREPRTEDR
jgi:amino acid adenylation domain-containing protein